MLCRAVPRTAPISKQWKNVTILVRTLRTRPGRDDRSSSTQDTSPQRDSPSKSEASNASNTQNAPPDVSSMLSHIDPSNNPLIAPVHIPEDANAVLRSDHPATNILAQSGLVVTRQVEMMNIFLGFEQANKYTIMDAQGNHVGYMAEHDGGIAKTMGRQWFRTHRAFTTHVFDKHAREVLRFHRPFSWINSRIRVYDPLEVGKYAPKSEVTEVSTDVKTPNTLDGIHQLSDLPLESMRVIGEAHSEWAPLRRKYNLFLAHELAAQGAAAQAIGSEPVPSDLSSKQLQEITKKHTDNFAQFAYINEPFLSWDFSLKGPDERLIGSVNRNFRGFGREIFTDTGMYILRMDSAGLEDEATKNHVVSQSHQSERAYAETVGSSNGSSGGLTLDQRAVLLGLAVSVDFDYFSRHSHGSGMFMPMYMGAGGEAGGAAGAGAAGAEAGGAAAGIGAAEGAGAAVGGAGRAVGGVGAGAAESGIAGAGTLAGYEAMQRGMGRGESTETTPDQSASMDPNSPQYGSSYDSQSPQGGFDPGPQSNDAWGSGEQDPWSAGQGGGGGEESGGGIFSWLWDIFFGD